MVSISVERNASMLVYATSDEQVQLRRCGAHKSLPMCRLLRPSNPNSLLINSLLVISQLARSTHAHYDALAGVARRKGVLLTSASKRHGTVGPL